MIKDAIAEGADVNAASWYGGTALMLAASRGHLRTVKVSYLLLVMIFLYHFLRFSSSQESVCCAILRFCSGAFSPRSKRQCNPP